MGLDEFPTPEAVPEWQQRIVDGAIELRKEELQLQQELSEQELETQLDEFSQNARQFGAEKKDAWSEVLGKEQNEESPEEIEARLSKGLLILTKDKMKEAS